jgi:hypothetical protein
VVISLFDKQLHIAFEKMIFQAPNWPINGLLGARLASI